MVATLHGGCLCGCVRYVFTQRLRFNPYACHCTDCQRRTGSAFGVQLTARVEDVTFSGVMIEGHHVQPSGAVARINACPQCLSRVYTTNNRRPGLINLRAGTLDNSKDMVPAFHVYVRSKQPWIAIPPGTPCFDANPATLDDWRRLLDPTPQT